MGNANEMCLNTAISLFPPASNKNGKRFSESGHMNRVQSQTSASHTSRCHSFPFLFPAVFSFCPSIDTSASIDASGHVTYSGPFSFVSKPRNPGCAGNMGGI